jgi:hypothetical protein
VRSPEKVPYRLTMQKSSANVFDYKDVKIRLQSLCDGRSISSEVARHILYQHVQLLK